MFILLGNEGQIRRLEPRLVLGHEQVHLLLDQAIVAATEVAMEVKRTWLLVADRLTIAVLRHEVLELQVLLHNLDLLVRGIR